MSLGKTIWFCLDFWRVLISNICCPFSLTLLRTMWTTWHLMFSNSIQACHDWSCICRPADFLQLCVHQCGGWARHLESKIRAGGSGIQVSWRSRHTSLLVSQYMYIYICIYIHNFYPPNIRWIIFSTRFETPQDRWRFTDPEPWRLNVSMGWACTKILGLAVPRCRSGGFVEEIGGPK